MYIVYPYVYRCLDLCQFCITFYHLDIVLADSQALVFTFIFIFNLAFLNWMKYTR